MACQFLFNNPGDNATNSDGTQTMQNPKDKRYSTVNAIQC